jgi:AraC-like DNA-binding protein
MAAPGYHEVRPPAHLRSGVACFWSNELPESPIEQVGWVVPDNCADIIMQLTPDDEVIQAYVVGTMTRPVAMRSRPVRFLGVRFHPGWLSPALGVQGHELRDLTVPLSDISHRLHAVLRRAHGRPSDVLAALANTAMHSGAAPPPVVREALRAIEASHGLVRIERLCRELRVTRQHLARRFDAALGISPKFAGRVVRMQRVLQRASGVARGEWARLAFESGYSDQSHLVEDLRELTGRTPTELAS